MARTYRITLMSGNGGHGERTKHGMRKRMRAAWSARAQNLRCPIMSRPGAGVLLAFPLCFVAVVVNSVREGEGDFGYNARTEVFENLFEAGVIDPTKVTRVALENAVSISGMVLTTECVITDIPEETPAPAAPPMGGGMGGMM